MFPIGQEAHIKCVPLGLFKKVDKNLLNGFLEVSKRLTGEVSFLVSRGREETEFPVQFFPQFLRRNEMNSLDTEESSSFDVPLGVVNEEDSFRLY